MNVFNCISTVQSATFESFALDICHYTDDHKLLTLLIRIYKKNKNI